MKISSRYGIVGLFSICLFSAGLLMAGHAQTAYAGICFNTKITASGHSAKNALRGVARKAKAKQAQLAARGVDASLPYAPTCSSNSGRATCQLTLRTCQ